MAATITAGELYTTTCPVCGVKGNALVTVAPTCVTDGVGVMNTRKCDCAATVVVPASAFNNHQWNPNTVVEATCTTDGMKGERCTYCQEWHLGAEVIPATGHAWGSWVNVDGTANHKRTCGSCSATETVKCSYVWQEASTAGYHVKYCATCGDYDSTGKHSGGTATCVQKAVCTTCGLSYGSLGDHIMDTYQEAPNLYNASTHTLECANCSYSVTSKHTMIDYACNNDEVHRSKCRDCAYMIWPAHTFTYVNDGTTHTGTCTACGDQVTGGHNFDTIYSYTNKVHTWVCTKCKAPYEEAHTMSAWDAVDASTCSRYCTTAKCNYVETLAHNWTYYDVGAETYHSGECTRCGHGTGAAHNYGDWTRVDGDNHQRICSTCGHVQTQAHTWGEWKANNEKTHTHTCSVCSETATSSHNWELVSETPATCISYKVTVKKCTVCNATSQTTVSQYADHNMGTPVITPATCTAEGKSVTKCQTPGCNYSETTVLPMVDHVEGDPVTNPEPTCCNEGLKSWYCVNCNKLLRTEKLPAKGHGEGEYKWVTVTPATCTEKGLEKKVCAHSGKELGETREIPELGHNMTGNPIVTPATCTAEGKSVKYCQRNGCNYSETTILPMVDHVEGDPVTNPEPTCCNEGLKSWYCVNCNKLLRTEKLPAKGHGEGEYKWVTVTPATCTEKGLEKKVCAHSGKELGETREIPALGHDMTGAPVVTPATCTAEGKSVKTCQRNGCGYSETTVLPMVDHVEGNPVTNPEPTCCNEGLKSWYCVNCNKLLRTETIPAKGHGEGEYKWVTVSEPTCTEEGLEKKVCAHSGKDLGETRAIPALGHIYVGLWEVGESDTHHRDCYRCGAGRKNVECTYLPLEIDDVMYHVCPVCGRFHEQELEAVEDAGITIATGSKPGASLVRMLAKPFGADEVRYPVIMTAIFEAEGYIADPAENVTGITVTVPMDDMAAFKLVFVHLDEATNELVWTDVPCTLANGVLTFTVEEMGLFLFVAE